MRSLKNQISAFLMLIMAACTPAPAFAETQITAEHEKILNEGIFGLYVANRLCGANVHESLVMREYAVAQALGYTREEINTYLEQNLTVLQIGLMVNGIDGNAFCNALIHALQKKYGA